MTDALLIRLPGGERRITPADGVVTIGRDPLCRLVIDDPRVSRQHAELHHDGYGWRLRDLGSSNGTYTAAGRVTTVEVVEACSIRLGGTDGPTVLLRPDSPSGPPPAPATQLGPDHLPAAPAASDYAPLTPAGPAPVPASSAVGLRFEAGRVPSARYQPVATRTRIGRAPDNDIVLGDLLVSGYHADLIRDQTGVRIFDHGTRNGTFVNGQEVSQAYLQPGDLLSFGHHQMVFDGLELREYVDTGRVSLRAEALTVIAKGSRTLLDRVSFDLPECSLLAVVGPSGAGKSTLLGALTGSRPAQRGAVWYEGRDLYKEYDDLRHRIGLVPQDDILHSQLTVRKALRFAASLRFGTDVTPAERDQRIEDVLAQLALTAHADQRIDTLSGGQRKRTSVALELLTEPSLLFLDEPTSGLDPALDRDVMTSLRELADRGRTVVVVTHSPLHLSVCDRVLVLGRGGKVAYYGPPDGVLPFFGATEYADVFQQVYHDPDGWAEWFAANRTGEQGTAAPVEEFTGSAPRPRQGWLRQVGVLTRRMAAVTAADRMYAALLLGLPLGLAALLHIIPGSDGFARPGGPLGRSAEAQQLLVVLIVGAVFFGLAGGIRELVGERAIYRRERAVGLSPWAYLSSKLLVFTIVNAVQAALFVFLGLLGRPGARDALVLGLPAVELFVVVWLTALACTVLGLLVSAYVSTMEQTMPVLVGLVMAQLVLSGGLFEVAGRAGVEQLAWLSPSRWGYAAAAATTDLRSIMAGPPAEALWRHSTGAWLWAAGVLCAQAALLCLGTRWALRRHEPGR
ncbi:FHA domain-containing protein [Longispora albida]|uniref:FHA domain-containing protein n=1 Tax=Longispora albida TaxID=203523 RepID=UPI0003676D2B|nr:FHA domain-containing protein [Longispora albida]